MSDIKTPYLNGHMYEFDLCWLVEKILSFESQLNQAIDLKTIHYADPIQWDITTQYAPNTVVVDPKTGTAYMSKVPVPAGILLTNVDYWTVIFNYQNIYTKIMEGVAFYNGQTDFASKALLVNDLVWYGLDLYRVTRAIEEGGKLIPGTNLVKTSIESLLSNYYGRDRVATLLNDTLNVSGDYTVNAGDIAEISTNRTIKVTTDREVDVDGNDSLHIDGASTLNVGGLRTEAYASDKTEGVTGIFTGKYGGTSFETNSQSWPVKFPTKTVDLADITIPFFINPMDYGAVGDGTTDDSNAIVEASKHGTVCDPLHTYKIDQNITINSSLYNCTFHMAPLASVTVNGQYVSNVTFYSDPSSLPTARGTYALIIKNNPGCAISNCTFKDMMNALHTEDSDNMIISNCVFRNLIQTASSIGGNGYGIVSTNCNNMIIQSNIFDDVARHGIYLTVEDNDPGCENVLISSNIFNFKNATTRTATELPIQTRNAKYVDITHNYFYNAFGCLWIIAETSTSETDSHHIAFHSNTAFNCCNDLRPNDDGCIVLSGTANNLIHDVYIYDNHITSYNVGLLKTGYSGSALVYHNYFKGEYVSRIIENVSEKPFDILEIKNNILISDRTDAILAHFYPGATNANKLVIDANTLNIQHLLSIPTEFTTLSELEITNNTITNHAGTDYLTGTLSKVTCYSNQCNVQVLMRNATIKSLRLSNDSNNIAFYVTRTDLANANPYTISESAYSLSANQIYDGVLQNATYTNLASLPTTRLRYGQIANTADSKVYMWAGKWIELSNAQPT